MNKTLIRLLVVPVVLLLAGFRLHAFLTNAPSETGDDVAPQTVYTGTSVMPQEAFLKIHALRGRLYSAKPPVLTDGEVDWLLQTRKAGSPTKPYAASTARARPLEVLLLAALSPAQKTKVFFAIVPDFESRDKWGATADRLRACDAVRTLHEKRGIPYLLPLLRHPEARVRERAKQALDALGDAPPPPKKKD